MITRRPTVLHKNQAAPAPAAARTVGTAAASTTAPGASGPSVLASPAVDAALAARHIGLPHGQTRPYTLRGTYRDSAPVTTDTDLILGTWQVPAGQVFVVQELLSILDCGTAIGLSGGAVITRGGDLVYDGAAAVDDWGEGSVTGAVGTFGAGEWLDSSALQLSFPMPFAGGSIIGIGAHITRNGVSSTCAVQVALVGYLTSEGA